MAFKKRVRRFLARVHDLQFQFAETFQDQDGSRVASRWQVTGRYNGIVGTKPNGAPFETTDTALGVEPNGLLRPSWVERNACEVHGAIIGDDARRSGNGTSATYWCLERWSGFCGIADEHRNRFCVSSSADAHEGGLSVPGWSEPEYRASAFAKLDSGCGVLVLDPGPSRTIRND